MGLGSTAKKIQKVADTAEKLYGKLNELREQVAEMRETVEATSARVERLEAESAKQQALVEALARERGIDVDDALDGVEPPGEAAVSADETAAADGTTAGNATE